MPKPKRKENAAGMKAHAARKTTKSPPPAEVCDADPASLSAARAQRMIANWVSPVTQVETVAVRAALGRIAAADIKSAVRVPNHTNSAMDGYALGGRDLPVMPQQGGAQRLHKHAHKKLRVIGVSMAGKPFDGEVGEGQCVRIMTGAVMPAGADSVVVQERVERAGDTITVQAGETPGGNVRRAGEDLEIGDVAIAAGRRLAPSHLGLAASLGFAELPVFRRPRVAFFSNGDELRAVGAPLEVGEVYDSNRYTLYGMLSEAGVEMVDMGLVADDPGAVRAAFEQAAQCADMVITTAGASVGEADYIRQTLEQIGEVGFSKVAIKPGRPMIFGRLSKSGGGVFFGLPGNPVSVMSTFRIFVHPALRRLAGEAATAPLRLMVKITSPLKKRPGRAEYQRGVLSTDATGATVVRSTGAQGSGILSSMGEANCFIILPADCADVEAGERVEVQPFSTA